MVINMLEQIKSKYILKKIFSYLFHATKIKFVKLNKNMKNILNINLLDYQLLSGIYLIDKRNGKGKEYNSYNDKLLFEGEYIDYKRFGYGKEYNMNGKLVFEGKYINGKRNGNGKEYFNDGKIKFKGIYLFGIKYNGKGYDKNKKIIYEIKEGKGYINE